MQLRIFAVITCLLVPSAARADTTLTTLAGQIINWSGSLTVGTYANGDYYIVAPSGVSFTSKSPSDTDPAGGILHGCQVNPDPPDSANWTEAKDEFIVQGFDSRLNSSVPAHTFYDAALNDCDSFPTPTFPAGSSVMLGYSLTSCTSEPQCLWSIEVVTIVASAPACGSGCAFRPPFAGTNKTLVDADTSDIRYDVLHDYVSQGALPSLAALESECIFRNPLYILSSGPETWEKYTPLNPCNTPRDNYYRGITWAVTDAMAALSSSASNASKQTLAIRMIQLGIDIYGEYMSGEWFAMWAGFCGPQKEALIFAASLINNGDMMSVAHPSNSGQRFCTTQVIKRVEQSDIDLNPLRPVGCGTNTVNTASSLCQPFTSAMIGRASLCNSSGTWYYNPQNCSSGVRATYDYMASGMVAIAMILSEMSLEEESGWPAYFEYLLSNTAWPDDRWYSYARVNSIGGITPCTGSSTSGANVRAVVCELMDTHRAGAATDGSIDPPDAGEPEVPVISATAPTTGTETTSATITFSGTASSGAGLASVTTHNSAPGQVDQVATGTTTWTRSRSLTDYAVNVLTATALGSDGGVNDSNAILVLRASSPATPTFDFTLDAGSGQSASWPNLPTIAFTDQGTNNVIKWQNNRAEGSGTFGRHFSYWSTSHTDFADDQFSEITIRDVPATNHFAYATVQAQGTTSTTYDNCHCTAEAGVSKVAQIVNSSRTQLGADISTTWASGDKLRCEVNATTDVVTVYKNGVSLATRNGCTLSGGQPGLGLWGAFPVDDFAAGNVAVGDTDGPIVAFVVPTSDPTFTTPVNTPTLNISGTATDATGVSACTYMNVQEGTTAATTGTTSWSATVALVAGQNDISVSCTDTVGGNPPGIANLTVTVPIPDPDAPTTRIRISRIR